MNICLIHSNSVLRKAFSDFLSCLGHNVLCFDSPQRLLKERPETAELDALILEMVELTVSSGLLHEIHSRFPDASIIGMIENGFTISAKDALAAGVYAYLHRPFDMEELELILMRLSESRGEGSAQ